MKIIKMRVLKMPFIVKNKFCARYENGWFEGDIEYYNENICKYHVSPNDGSDVYIGEDDIDMIEVIVF